MAQALRRALATQDVSLTHSQSLELIAQAFGLDNWNILAAKIEAERPSRPAPAPTSDGTKTLYCSFCGKSQHAVQTLIAGPDVSSAMNATNSATASSSTASSARRSTKPGRGPAPTRWPLPRTR
jgi:hypothetical protein